MSQLGKASKSIRASRRLLLGRLPEDADHLQLLARLSGPGFEGALVAEADGIAGGPRASPVQYRRRRSAFPVPPKIKNP